MKCQPQKANKGQYLNH